MALSWNGRPLTDFKRHTAEFLAQLKETRPGAAVPLEGVQHLARAF